MDRFGPGATAGKQAVLARCYRNSLQVAAENAIKTIAFPAISCGAYGYPIEEAARIAVETTRDFLSQTDQIEKAFFVVASREILESYRRFLS